MPYKLVVFLSLLSSSAQPADQAACKSRFHISIQQGTRTPQEFTHPEMAPCFADDPTRNQVKSTTCHGKFCGARFTHALDHARCCGSEMSCTTWANTHSPKRFGMSNCPPGKPYFVAGLHINIADVNTDTASNTCCSQLPSCHDAYSQYGLPEHGKAECPQKYPWVQPRTCADLSGVHSSPNPSSKTVKVADQPCHEKLCCGTSPTCDISFMPGLVCPQDRPIVAEKALCAGNPCMQSDVDTCCVPVVAMPCSKSVQCTSPSITKQTCTVSDVHNIWRKTSNCSEELCLGQGCTVANCCEPSCAALKGCPSGSKAIPGHFDIPCTTTGNCIQSNLDATARCCCADNLTGLDENTVNAISNRSCGEHLAALVLEAADAARETSILAILSVAVIATLMSL